MNSQKRITFEIIKPPHVRIADLFLHEGEEFWPSGSRPGQTDCTEEGKQELLKINFTFQSNKSLPLLDAEKFSSWLRLLRTTAYVLRFISKCKIAGLQKEQRNVSSDNQEKNIGPNANLKETLEPRKGNQECREVLGSRSSKRTLYRRADEFERRRNCL